MLHLCYPIQAEHHDIQVSACPSRRRTSCSDSSVRSTALQRTWKDLENELHILKNALFVLPIKAHGHSILQAHIILTTGPLSCNREGDRALRQALLLSSCT